MGKAKRRSLNQGINNKFQYMTRESALDSVVKNLDKKYDIIQQNSDRRLKYDKN